MPAKTTTTKCVGGHSQKPPSLKLTPLKIKEAKRTATLIKVYSCKPPPSPPASQLRVHLLTLYFIRVPPIHYPPPNPPLVLGVRLLECLKGPCHCDGGVN